MQDADFDRWGLRARDSRGGKGANGGSAGEHGTAVEIFAGKAGVGAFHSFCLLGPRGVSGFQACDHTRVTGPRTRVSLVRYW